MTSTATASPCRAGIPDREADQRHTAIIAVISVVDFTALAGATSGADPASTAKTIEELTSSPTAIVGTAGFVVGHVVGLILIGVALLRARVIPVPATWILIISAPLHLVFAVIVPSNARRSPGA
ncbi:membrane hypothetical protein [Frankia sp. AiPs1]